MGEALNLFKREEVFGAGGGKKTTASSTLREKREEKSKGESVLCNLP